jgi:predicted nucleic acid-binding protein
MRTVVADASAIVDYLLRTTVTVDPVIEDRSTDLHLPALCDVEVCAALRRALLERRLTVERCTEALQDYLDLPATRHGHVRLLVRVLQLRANLTAYDASYVALAERLGGALLTTDDRLKRAVAQIGRMEVL